MKRQYKASLPELYWWPLLSTIMQKPVIFYNFNFLFLAVTSFLFFWLLIFHSSSVSLMKQTEKHTKLIVMWILFSFSHWSFCWIENTRLYILSLCLSPARCIQFQMSFVLNQYSNYDGRKHFPSLLFCFPDVHNKCKSSGGTDLIGTICKLD